MKKINSINEFLTDRLIILMQADAFIFDLNFGFTFNN